jgi:peptidoglycan lytic transglycosylase
MKFLLLALLFVPTPAPAWAEEGVLPGSSVLRTDTAASLDKLAPNSVAHAVQVDVSNNPDDTGTDDDFLAARDAFRAGDASRFERSAARLKNSPLEPYLAYYRLRMNLQTEDAATVQKFLARPDDTPVIDRLRGEWLKQLGSNRQWDMFMAEYPHLLNGDTELTCYALQARRNLQEDDALREARSLWLANGEDLPDSCTPLFEAALARGVIGEEDVWTRIRLALEGGNISLAKSLAKKLPQKNAPSAAALSAAAANPARYLARTKLKKSDRAQRVVALFALQRLAKQSPQLAYVRWGKIMADFPAAEQHYFYAWLGYEAARKLDARALEWFMAADDAPLTEQQLAWRTRAALRALDWQAVLSSINRMSPQQQLENAWLYWKGRALKALGRTDEANALFSALSGKYNFYGQLAAEELGNSPASDIMSSAYQPGEEELKAMLARPAVQRALALYRMDLRTDAAREWAWAVRNFNDRQLLVAAEVARRNEMYDRAINTADRTVQLHDFSLRYLAPYREALQTHIRENNLEEAWVYGLMRQESRFVTKAKSNAGAAGIMQIMPATARWVARKLGMKHYRKSLIHEVDTNLALGTYYMKTVMDWFDDNPVLASAAYNAGPTRARQWRGDIPLEGAIYAETIPFDETRDYVKKVMSNTVYYAALFGQPPRSLKERLGVVAARDAVNQLPVPDER